MSQLQIPTVSGTPLHVSDIQIFDDVLAADEQQRLLAYLCGPGWAFGAFSDPSPTASRYWYKHFAGIVRDGGETAAPREFEAQLEVTAAPVARMWNQLKSGILAGHELSRCYANGYPAGSEGGLHLDSNVSNHFTTIYYPHTAWSPNFAGETVFFNRQGTDIIAAIYPRPNRLVVFPGIVPHVARGVSRSCPHLRVTLMFKTVRP